MANILVIAGSDPSAQAGLQVDLQVIRSRGHRGCSVITAVTAQNDERVYSVNPVDTRVLKDQLRAVLSAYTFDAVKVGLLVSNEISYQVYRILEQHKVKNIVVDPIMRASSGAVLLENAALPILTGYLLPLARMVTPNLDEAETLSGMTVRDLDQMGDAARKIMNESPGLNAVLIKGGHLTTEKTDILWDGMELYRFPTEQTFAGSPRGTGCILSTAIACALANGADIREAVRAAKNYLQEFIPSRLA